jgi:hypothetical protein
MQVDNGDNLYMVSKFSVHIVSEFNLFKKALADAKKTPGFDE